MSKKKITLSVITGIVAIALVASATFAWFTTMQTALNKFNTKDGASNGVSLVEDFDQPPEVLPGVEVDKKVSVVQTGTGKALVRVRLEELFQTYESDTNKDGRGILKIFKEDAPNLDPGRTYYSGVGMIDYYDEIPGLKPITISAEAMELLKTNNGCTTAVAPARILGGAAPANLQVWEKVTVEIVSDGTGDSDGKTITTYKYIGFYEMDEIDASGNPTGVKIYQTVNLTPGPGFKDTDPNPSRASLIEGVTYNYKKLQPAAKGVHLPDDPITGLPVDHGTPSPSGPIDHENYVLLTFGANVKHISEFTTAEKCWFYDDDGWAYWGDLLSEGESTDFLLLSFMLDEDAEGEMVGMDYRINVRMQACQPTMDALMVEWLANFAGNTGLDIYGADDADPINGQYGYPGKWGLNGNLSSDLYNVMGAPTFSDPAQTMMAAIIAGA